MACYNETCLICPNVFLWYNYSSHLRLLGKKSEKPLAMFSITSDWGPLNLLGIILRETFVGTGKSRKEVFMLEVTEMLKKGPDQPHAKAQSLCHKQLCATTVLSFLHHDGNVRAQETFVQCWKKEAWPKRGNDSTAIIFILKFWGERWTNFVKSESTVHNANLCKFCHLYLKLGL